MKNHDGTARQPAAEFDVSRVTGTIRQALASAGLDTRVGPMKGVTDTIERALSVAGLMRRNDTRSAHGDTIDGTAREIDTRNTAIDLLPQWVEDPPIVGPTPQSTVTRPGEFLERSFATAAGSRRYKIYVPAGYSAAADESAPLVVMLHGCTQSPDDFAAGTRMNALADEHGFIVVYPEQCAKAHAQKCWNWFRTEDQARDSGEPAIIAGMTREVASLYRIDERRIFVAGMSAGAAMAVILGATYPELFAAIGAHSGLPYGVAHDVPSAFGAMHGGGSIIPGSANCGRRTPPPSSAPSSVVPTIVFHGDRDHTVNVRNAAAIVEQVTSHPSQPGLHARSHTGTTPAGCAYSRTQYVDAADRTLAEHWVLHGAGHAWSGGSPEGSFTDAAGPDASAEMIRFFYSQHAAGTG